MKFSWNDYEDILCARNVMDFKEQAEKIYWGKLAKYVVRPAATNPNINHEPDHETIINFIAKALEDAYNAGVNACPPTTGESFRCTKDPKCMCSSCMSDLYLDNSDRK